MTGAPQNVKGSRSIRVLEVLEAVVASPTPLGVSELMAATGLPRASLHRILNLLDESGYLRTGQRGKGVVGGPRLLELAQSTLTAGHERAHRHGVLSVLSRQIGETCNMSVPDGDAMVYFDGVETEWPLRHQLPVGTRVPLHCTAAGKLYLSRLGPRSRDKLLSVLPLPRHTPNSITDRAGLEAALVDIGREGVGCDNSEFIEDMVAIAVPVTDSAGRMMAALAFHAPTVRMNLGAARKHLPAMRAAAKALSDGADAKSDAADRQPSDEGRRWPSGNQSQP